MNKTKFTIITPTTGNFHLKKLLESINSLTQNDLYEVEHLIVVDGTQFKELCDVILNDVKPNDYVKREVIYLPFNTGANGYLGHKIYSAVPHLIDCDYVIFLDEDNYLEPNHVEIYYNILTNKKLDWCYCLRNIIDQENNFICKDMCESLGYIHNVFYDKNQNLIDTNCYCISRKLFCKISYFFNSKDATNNINHSDRTLATELMSNHKNYLCTYEYTLNYRTSGRDTSVTNKMFTTGNDSIKKMYGLIPWENKNTQIYVISSDYTEEKTKTLLAQIYLGAKINVPEIDTKVCTFLNYYSKFKPAGHKILKLGVE